jgi:hypothetical protein
MNITPILRVIALTVAAFPQIGFAQKEIPMLTEKGNITLLFEGFSPDRLTGGANLQASIRNDTQFMLRSVSFEMIGYDANGNDIKECGTIIGCWFEVFDPIAAGATRRITSPGDFVLIQTSRPVARAEFRIRQASYFIKYEIQSEPFENVKFTISPSFDSKGIGLSFLNKSEDVIEVAWDQSVYIDEDGNSSRLIRGNVNLAEKDRPQPNTVIPPGTKLQETVFPIDRVKLDKKGKWAQDPDSSRYSLYFCKRLVDAIEREEP